MKSIDKKAFEKKQREIEERNRRANEDTISTPGSNYSKLFSAGGLGSGRKRRDSISSNKLRFKQGKTPSHLQEVNELGPQTTSSLA